LALLAVLKAGARYVPVDPAHPVERIAYLLTDSAPVAVLCQPAFMARLQALGFHERGTPVIDLALANWLEQTGNPHI
ncbi:AMP-binding protein, partial [Pseudomonas syringae pv. tagetis]|uniref:AMP-binding protein n=1 Tax=Pseudomonas syringae group genomosp. 7 TaxID=251699 RepID=UPI00377055D0